jgi:hypothetical protein
MGGRLQKLLSCDRLDSLISGFHQLWWLEEKEWLANERGK